jgi:alpha-1,2-mannosyltransferase
VREHVRPEKEHATQLVAFSKFLQSHDDATNVKLVLAGSVRNPGDEERVKGLKQLAQTLGIDVRGSNGCFSASL